MRLALVGLALIVVGSVALATGLLPLATVLHLGQRIWPILLFVVAITVLTELAASAGLFVVAAERLARWGLGRAWMLWIFVVLLATASTIFLSLDTTAVLLTPVVITITRHAGLPPMPFALTTVWLANSASLLLPVSNLTNLLASSRMSGYSPLGFVALMVAPAVAAIAVPCLILFLVYRKQLLLGYTQASRTVPEDRPLLIVTAVVVVSIIPALVSGVPVWIPASVGAVLLCAAFAIRRPSALRLTLLPWQLILLVCGLFLVVATASSLGLDVLLGSAGGRGEGFLSLLRLSGASATASNLVNNLPAYLALEPVAGSPRRVAALLIGVNAGPLITPWGSLATLLWRDRLNDLGVSVSWLKFASLGLIVVPLTVFLAVLMLAWLG